MLAQLYRSAVFKKEKKNLKIELILFSAEVSKHEIRSDLSNKCLFLATELPFGAQTCSDSTQMIKIQILQPNSWMGAKISKANRLTCIFYSHNSFSRPVISFFLKAISSEHRDPCFSQAAADPQVPRPNLRAL